LDKKIIIAIDGFSSTGKSTLAKQLAKYLGYTNWAVYLEEIKSSSSSEFFNVNVIGTSNFLESLSVSIPKQFVFISSVSVYGLIEGENIDESHPLLALDPYGKSKIEAEKLVKEWCKERNVICTILRLPLVVGVNPPGNLGTMLRAIKNGYYFNIAGGNANKSMVLASDISKFLRMSS
jgi:nucleoside-diphosphate-sugar epimerase